MNIAVASNRAFLKYLYVMLTSLLEQDSRGDKDIYIYLLSADFSDEDAEMIRRLVEGYGECFHFIRIETDWFPKELPRNEYITVESYFRLAIADLLPPEAERVLYLDVDLIVNRSLRGLYETDFEGKSLIGCPDVTSAAKEYLAGASLFAALKEKEGFLYFNAGVLLMHLKKLRQRYTFSSFMEQAAALKDELVFHDQDLLNYLFWNDVKYMQAERYNLPVRTAYNAGFDETWAREHTVVWHYAGPKPWRHKEVRYPLERLWWDYAKKTPYYTELLEEMVLPEIDTGYMDELFRQLKQENEQLKAVVDQCMKLLGR